MSLAGLGTGLKSAFNVASLLLQDIVARSISLTQATGLVAVQLVTGARLKLGGGTTDYLTSNGTTIITAAGDFVAGTLSSSGTNTLSGNTALNLTGASAFLWFNNASGTSGHITSSVSAANAGASAAAAALKLYPQLALDATDFVLSVGNVNNTASVFAVAYNGSIRLPTTDSSGTPGAATIDQATGRSAIALGASSAVITNSLVTAASHVFISPRTRDATGLLPLVTTIGAGSFTVSVTANCTADLVFDWLVIT